MQSDSITNILSQSTDTIINNVYIKDTVDLVLKTIEDKGGIMWSQIILAAISAIITIVAIVIGYWNVKKQIQSNKETNENNLKATNENMIRQIKGNTETKFRQEWIDNLRNTLSKHASELISIQQKLSIYPLEKLTFDDKREPSDKKLNEIYELIQEKIKDFNEYSYKLMLIFNSEKPNHIEAYNLVLDIHSCINHINFADPKAIWETSINQYTLIKLSRIITINEWKKIQSDPINNQIVVDIVKFREEARKEFIGKKI